MVKEKENSEFKPVKRHLRIKFVLIRLMCGGLDIKRKLATVVKGDLKGPLSIATTPRCRGGHYSIPWIVPLYP